MVSRHVNWALLDMICRMVRRFCNKSSSSLQLHSSHVLNFVLVNILKAGVVIECARINWYLFVILHSPNLGQKRLKAGNNWIPECGGVCDLPLERHRILHINWIFCIITEPLLAIRMHFLAFRFFFYFLRLQKRGWFHRTCCCRTETTLKLLNALH